MSRESAVVFKSTISSCPNSASYLPLSRMPEGSFTAMPHSTSMCFVECVLSVCHSGLARTAAAIASACAITEADTRVSPSAAATAAASLYALVRLSVASLTR